jgi:ATP phosphoribosyltransferase regulatory subunit HisZ
MSILDGILSQVAGSPDTIASIAEKVGIDPAMAEQAVAALGQSHAEDGDTVELAAEKTGLDAGALGGIMEQMGGEGALGDLASKMQGEGGEGGALSGIASMLDRDGDGNPINDVMGMAKGLFGKN